MKTHFYTLAASVQIVCRNAIPTYPTHFYTLAAAVLCMTMIVRAQSVLTTITVAPDISPFISDWREDATMVFVRIDNFGGAEVPRAIVHVTITGIKAGEIVQAKSKEFSIPQNSSITLYGNDKLLDVKSVSFQGEIQKKITASNRIPDDHFDICADVIDLSNEKVISNSCTQFDVRAASAPLLLQPADGEIVTTKYPIFQWIPSRTTNKIEARYSIHVFPARPYQTAQQSLASGTVKIFEKTDLTVPNVLMTTEAIELEDGQPYVWQVQARDRSNKPLGENDGNSEVFQFTYMSPESFHKFQIQNDSVRAAQDTTSIK